MKKFKEYLQEKQLMGNKAFISEPEDMITSIEYNRLKDIMKKDGISTKYWDGDDILTISEKDFDVIKKKWKKVKKNRYSKNGLIIMVHGKDPLYISLYVPSYQDSVRKEI